MTRRRLGVGGAVVGGDVVPGDVLVEDGRVVEVGRLAGRDWRPNGKLAVAGFVDLQVNGFAGVDFTTADLEGYAAASVALARSGVTTALATIPTASPAQYGPALATARRACTCHLSGTRFLGVHMEGPFLSPERAGAHRVEWLRRPDVALVQAWMAAAPVLMMTVAPELPGAIELIDALCRAGVVVSLGHTDAGKTVAHRAFDAGATMVTHLWNAQRPPTSREPAVGGVGLARSDVHVGVICDLVHVDADTLRFSFAAADNRFVTVTDAVAWAGMPDGTYHSGMGEVTKSDGAIRLASGTLAGSAASMDEMLRNLVSIGVALPRAVAAMTTAPATALGAHGVGLGRLQVGAAADVVVLDDALAVHDVLVGGTSVA